MVNINDARKEQCGLQSLIANDIFEGVTPKTVRRIITFARLHAPAGIWRVHAARLAGFAP
jgi:hypothetical protein